MSSNFTFSSRPLTTFVSTTNPNALTDNIIFTQPVVSDSFYQNYVNFPKEMEEMIPDNFNHHKTKWKNLMTKPVDQKDCGSCWAYSVCSCLSDRYNIWTSQFRLQASLSPVLTISCNPFLDVVDKKKVVTSNIDTGIEISGCEGNFMIAAIYYAYFFGICSEKCLPYYSSLYITNFQQQSTNYSFQSANPSRGSVVQSDKPWYYRFEDTQQPSCSYLLGQQDLPYDYCVNSINVDKTTKFYGVPYQHFYISHFYKLTTEKQIQLDILSNGPVCSAFLVYEDFYIFSNSTASKTDVYIHDSKNYPTIIGGHAIEIVGWGISDDNIPFWWIKNSWGTEFGDEGYFRYRRGNNMGEIEMNGVGFFPDVKINYKNYDLVKQCMHNIARNKNIYFNLNCDLFLSTLYKQNTKKNEPNLNLDINNKNLDKYFDKVLLNYLKTFGGFAGMVLKSSIVSQVYMTENGYTTQMLRLLPYNQLYTRVPWWFEAEEVPYVFKSPFFANYKESPQMTLTSQDNHLFMAYILLLVMTFLLFMLSLQTVLFSKPKD